MKVAPLAAHLPLVLAGLALAQDADAQCEILKLTGTPPAPYLTSYGFSVSLRGDRMAVGATYGGSLSKGSVDVFERQDEAAAWVLVGTLVASDGDEYQEFGYSVAVDGDTLVVGAKHGGLLGAKGAAYVFERQSDGTWLETAKLLPPDDGWAFGWAVDVDGDRIAVGAKGASSLSGGKGLVVVFEGEGSSWVKKFTIKPSISDGGDGFGASLDLEGERLVVGAPYGWTGTPPSEGLAFVYERGFLGYVWYEKAVLSPGDLMDHDRFGQDVALDGDRIVVGAPVHDLPIPFVGVAYVFDLVEGAWTQTAKLIPSDVPQLTYFGLAVDAEGGRIVIGARTDSDVAPGAGAVYLFEENSAGWVEAEKFYGSGTETVDVFGTCLDLEGSEVLVGAPYAGSLSHPGHAFLFDLDPEGPSLLADSTSISLSQGGVQTLQLGACQDHAGDVYVLAGTATGTSPGFVLAGKPVPLNADAYFLHTLQHLAGPPLTGGLGLLDFNGFGEASFTLPPGIEPALAGLVLHHAYCVLDAATLAIEAVSPAVPVSLVP